MALTKDKIRKTVKSSEMMSDGAIEQTVAAEVAAKKIWEKKGRRRAPKAETSKKVPQGVWSPLFIGDQNLKDPKRQAAWERAPKRHAA